MKTKETWVKMTNKMIARDEYLEEFYSTHTWKGMDIGWTRRETKP